MRVYVDAFQKTPLLMGDCNTKCKQNCKQSKRKHKQKPGYQTASHLILVSRARPRVRLVLFRIRPQEI